MFRRSKDASETWKNLPWKKLQKDLFRLQKRVFKAIRDGNKRKAISLIRLILKSTAARMLAIRQVTQLNAGKKTAGIDGKASLNHEERLNLSEELRARSNDWKHQKLREIPIPKKDGKTRLLKVPTIGDRAWQCKRKTSPGASARSDLPRKKLRVPNGQGGTRRPEKSVRQSKLCKKGNRKTSD